MLTRNGNHRWSTIYVPFIRLLNLYDVIRSHQTATRRSLARPRRTEAAHSFGWRAPHTKSGTKGSHVLQPDAEGGKRTSDRTLSIEQRWKRNGRKSEELRKVSRQQWKKERANDGAAWKSGEYNELSYEWVREQRKKPSTKWAMIWFSSILPWLGTVPHRLTQWWLLLLFSTRFIPNAEPLPTGHQMEEFPGFGIFAALVKLCRKVLVRGSGKGWSSPLCIFSGS